jgi:hypothetical protein
MTNISIKDYRYAITKQQTGYITLLVIPRQISIDHKTNYVASTSCPKVGRSYIPIQAEKAAVKF